MREFSTTIFRVTLLRFFGLNLPRETILRPQVFPLGALNRVKIGVRVKIKLKIVFETINLILPENLGLLGLFLSKIE